MGLFGVFKKERKWDIETVVIGYMRTESAQLLGVDPISPKYAEKVHAMSRDIETLLVPNLNRQLQQEVFDTLSAACPGRVKEAFGEYVALVFLRYAYVQQAVRDGKVKAGDATLDIVCDALHQHIKKYAAKPH